MRNRQKLLLFRTPVDEFPYASSAQRYIFHVQILNHARFEVFASVLKNHVCDITRCGLVLGNRCSAVACCLHLLSSPRTVDCHEYEGIKLLPKRW
jgi:hypothetical protein